MNMYVVCELPAIVNTKVDWELYVFVLSGAMSVPPDQGPARFVAQKTLSGLFVELSFLQRGVGFGSFLSVGDVTRPYLAWLERFRSLVPSP